MKKRISCMLLLLISVEAMATQVITISRFQTGKEIWPLTREEIMLACEKDGALFAINPSTLMQYPLNDKAQAKVNAKVSIGEPISVIQMEDKAHPGQKMSLMPVIRRAEALCGRQGGDTGRG